MSLCEVQAYAAPPAETGSGVPASWLDSVHDELLPSSPAAQALRSWSPIFFLFSSFHLLT